MWSEATESQENPLEVLAASWSTGRCRMVQKDRTPATSTLQSVTPSPVVWGRKKAGRTPSSHSITPRFSCTQSVLRPAGECRALQQLLLPSHRAARRRVWPEPSRSGKIPISSHQCPVTDAELGCNLKQVRTLPSRWMVGEGWLGK